MKDQNLELDGYFLGGIHKEKFWIAQDSVTLQRYSSLDQVTWEAISNTDLNDYHKKQSEWFPADLFQRPELLPKHIQSILQTFTESGDRYDQCRALLAKLEPEGYTFDYYLDGVPFNLKKIEMFEEQLQELAKLAKTKGYDLDTQFDELIQEWGKMTRARSKWFEENKESAIRIVKSHTDRKGNRIKQKLQ